MLNLNKNNFVLDLKGSLFFSAEITHKDDETIHLFIKKISHPEFEKYDLPFLAFQHLTEENIGGYLDNLFEGAPEELKNEFENNKDFISKFFLSFPIIFIDNKSFSKLQKNDLFVKCILYHELGHYMHSDDIYEDKNEERESILTTGRVSKKELDADEFAYSVFGTDFYDALVDSLNKCLEASKQVPDDVTFLVPAIELRKRIDRLIEIIQKDRKEGKV